MGHYVLYALKSNNSRVYIANTNPIIWNPDISCAKKFMGRYTPEYYILRTAEVYRYIKHLIEVKGIMELHILLIEDGIEKEDYKLL